MADSYPQLGQYLPIDLLGRGGMAEVLLAISLEDPEKPKRFIAIKKLLPRVAADRTIVQRLIDEAKVCALLSHPNIVQVYDLGVSGHDIFLAMEFINGKSLDSLIDRIRKNGKTFPREALYYVIRQVAEALAYAHTATDGANRSLDVVHRDVSPANILIGYDGSVKLTDFGIATAERLAGASASVTLGKLPYMSPEQLRGGAIDRRADIYSLGAVLYEGATLHLPYEATSAVELQQRILKSEPNLDLPEIKGDPHLFDVLSECLQKDPEKRPRTAMFLAEQLASPATIDIQTGKVALALLLTEYFGHDREAENRRRDEAIERNQHAISPSMVPDDFSVTGNSEVEVEKTEWKYAVKEEEKTRIAPNPNRMQAPVAAEIPRQELGRIELAQIAVARSVGSEKPILEVPSEPERRLVSEPALIPKESSIPPAKPVFIPRQSSYSKPAPVGLFEKIRTGNYAPLLELIRRFGIPILGIFLGIVLLGSLVRRWSQYTPVALGMIRQVNVYISIEKNIREEDMKEMSRWVLPNSREELWLRPLSRFFAREYRRATGKNEVPFTFRHGDPRLEIDSVNWEGSFFLPAKPIGLLEEIFALQKTPVTPGMGRLFVHVYSKRIEEPTHYPLDYLGDRPSGEGVVFVPLQRKEDAESLTRMAHEIGHLLGAKDKYDRRGLAIFPQGYVRPKQDPLYPQQAAEFMTRGIPLSVLAQKPIPNLEQVQVGPESAKEMGWLSSPEKK